MRKLKILVACEESQTVTKEFRALGHEAYSCDILPCSGGHPEWHIQVQPVIYEPNSVVDVMSGHKLGFSWDLVIAHPPCTRLANSGVRWLRERNLWNDLARAIALFNQFIMYGESGRKIAIENPIPHRYAINGFTKEDSGTDDFWMGIGKYSQLIQPYQFGHTEKKATCLWLFGLPKLEETKNVYSEMMQLDYKDRAKIHYTSPGKDRAKLRSKTYQGIAKAMAEQWSEYLLKTPQYG